MENKYIKKTDLNIILDAIKRRNLEVIKIYVKNEKIRDEIQEIIDSHREKNMGEIIEKEYLADIFSQISPADYDFIEDRINNIEIIKLLIYSGNIQYLKEQVENENIDLEKRALMVSGTKEKEYINDFLEKYDQLLSLSAKTNLIISTGDKELIRKALQNENLEEIHKIDLLIALKDEERIKRAIKDGEVEKINLLLREVKDIEFIEEEIKELNLEGWEILILVEDIDIPKLTERYIKGNELSLEEKLELSYYLKDPNLIKEFIDQNFEELKEKEDKLLDLIIYTKDMQYILEKIQNPDLNFSDEQKVEMICRTKNKDSIKMFLESQVNLSDENKNRLRVNLDENLLDIDIQNYKKFELDGMTYGIEIESEGISYKALPAAFLNNRWKAKKDNSLNLGVEVISPILKNNEADNKDIYRICYMLKKVNQSASERCGGHVHIGADYLTSKEAYLNLIEIYGNCENIIYLISNAPNSSIRMGISKFSFPMTHKLMDAIENKQITEETSMDEIIGNLKLIQEDRHAGINFMNIGTYKNTIEFRMANGTIDPDIWVENINLFGGIIKAAEELANIEKKGIDELTKSEKEKMFEFFKLKSLTLSPEEKLEALLMLTISEENREIYRNRYKKNIELLQGKEIINEMKDTIAIDPINVRDIGKKVLTGETLVDGRSVAMLHKGLTKGDGGKKKDE